jgi:hypothetical protein
MTAKVPRSRTSRRRFTDKGLGAMYPDAFVARPDNTKARDEDIREMYEGGPARVTNRGRVRSDPRGPPTRS